MTTSPHLISCAPRPLFIMNSKSIFIIHHNPDVGIRPAFKMASNSTFTSMTTESASSSSSITASESLTSVSTSLITLDPSASATGKPKGALQKIPKVGNPGHVVSSHAIKSTSFIEVAHRIKLIRSSRKGTFAQSTFAHVLVYIMYGVAMIFAINFLIWSVQYQIHNEV